MATVKKKCKVCGAEYDYCHTLIPGVFRWQDVACCREHALEYFAQVEAARAAETAAATPEPAPETQVEASTEPEAPRRKTRKKSTPAKSTEE